MSQLLPARLTEQLMQLLGRTVGQPAVLVQHQPTYPTVRTHGGKDALSKPLVRGENPDTAMRHQAAGKDQRLLAAARFVHEGHGIGIAMLPEPPDAGKTLA